MPVRITRVYTRTGDDGTTALVGGTRVSKDSKRIAAYGTIDELNASLGLARVFNEERLAEGEGHQWLDDVLRRLQNELFDLGSELATPEEAVYEGMFRFSEQESKRWSASWTNVRRNWTRSNPSSCLGADGSVGSCTSAGRYAVALSVTSWRFPARKRSTHTLSNTSTG